MSTGLKPGQPIQSLRSGSMGHLGPLLGAGGQGEVFRATLAGREVAIKWYFPAQATDDQRQAIEQLVSRGAPTRRFLWPEDLVVAPGRDGFGYSMGLRPADHHGLVALMKGRIDPSFTALCTAGYQLAESFLELHGRGLCYRDISFGNVFFHPDSGDVLICDNDNVGIDNTRSSGVLGTPRFMAPEVVRGEANPSTATDLWSLSVLLFYLLMVHHPLEGAREAAIKCLDLPAMNRLYGTHPLFVFHPTDRSNAPVPGLHDNVLAYWPLYPTFVRALFQRAFVDGLDDPNQRVRESEWRGALLRLRDSIIYCQSCGAECFYDTGTLRTAGNLTCWGCETTLRLPYRLKVGSHVIMLNHNTRLYPHHVNPTRLYDLDRPVAEVTQHPQDPSRWGLKNLGQRPWTLTTASGATQPVPPGRSAALADGSRIAFGAAEGALRG